MQRNPHFDVEELLLGGASAFDAINTALYGGAEGREGVKAMAAPEVAEILLSTFQEYEDNDTFMVTSEEHPSGHILEHTRLFGLTVGEPTLPDELGEGEGPPVGDLSGDLREISVSPSEIKTEFTAAVSLFNI